MRSFDSTLMLELEAVLCGVGVLDYIVRLVGGACYCTVVSNFLYKVLGIPFHITALQSAASKGCTALHQVFVF